MEVIHPRTVFLTKRNLPLVAQLHRDIVAQSLITGRAGKAPLRFGMRFGRKPAYFGRIDFFQLTINVLHKCLSEKISDYNLLFSKSYSQHWFRTLPSKHFRQAFVKTCTPENTFSWH